MSKVVNAILAILERVASNNILMAVRNSFIITLPIVMAGSLAVLINNLPIPAYQSFMLDTFGANWKIVGEYIYNGTFAVMSPIVCISISYNMAMNHNHKHPVSRVNPVITAMIGFVALLTIMYSTADGVNPLKWAGVGGLFLSMLIAMAASNLFILLSNVKAISLKFYAEDSDFSTPNAMETLLPAIITVLLFALFRALLLSLQIDDIFQFTYDLMQKPFKGVKDGPMTAFLYVSVLHVLWFFGIHGANVIDPVTNDLYKTAIADNIAAVAQGLEAHHIFTKPFFDVFVFPGGAGATISLLIVLLFAKRISTRRIGQYSLIPAIFNINEIIIFGLPIVLNPFLLVPFVLTPIVMGISSYLFTVVGILPITVVDVVWTTPPLINAYVATNSIAGVFVQLFNIALGVVIYIPFIKAYENAKKREFQNTFNELVEICVSGNSQSSATLIARDDAVGAAARKFANDLEIGLKKNELFLEYQPQVNALTGKVYGVEALLRWNHPQQGLIPPPVIINIAEDTDMINQLGYRVLEEATTQLAKWKADGLRGVRMSVNASVTQLKDSQLPGKIAAMLKQKNLEPKELEIEVTEAIALSTNATQNVTLQAIHAKGINIAIDDFGMGHSSLLYLRQFPVDVLKLDSSLSKNVLKDQHTVEIIATIRALCDTLNVEMIVEHVESAPQLEALIKIGLENIQGYFFSRPLKPDAAFEFITKANTGGLMQDYLPSLSKIYKTHVSTKLF